jgi:chromate transporter
MKREEVSGRRVTFGEALRFWIKLGWISFGGPAGQIAIMHRELVERRRWLSEGRFLHALNYCMMLPGPEATQLAIYVGWLVHRTPGGIVAGVFFVIPSILVLLLLSYVYAAHGNTTFVTGLLSGFKPVVVAIVVEAVIRIGRRALKRRAHLFIAAASFASIYVLHVPFPLIVLLAGLAGYAGTRFWPRAFADESKKVDDKVTGETNETDGLPLVIDDSKPQPPHTLPSRARALKVLGVGLALWLLPLAPLAWPLGAGGIHAQEYFYFTKAAFVTFGGAYAVLAYVTQAVTVEPYNWLAPAQAVDGLALAETTPGPLIMVLQFVGFMAGWNHPPAGLSPAASGVAGALVTTYATFLPCFVFIFVGAPYIEVIRGKRSLVGALAGVTAAVVGVILNLALVFGTAVIWPHGLAGGPDWFAVALGAAAFLALYRLKLDVLWVVLAGGLLGLARTFFR